MKNSLIQKVIKLFKRNKKKVLVISWWGFRWLYAVGILKWLEELWLDKEINTVFWVSIGSIIGGLRCGWKKADEILKLFLDLSVDKFYGKEIFGKTWWLLSNKKIKNMICEYIPDSFDKLDKKLYVWAVDTNKAVYKLFEKWDLQNAILGSMSIPWVFPPVQYWDDLLVDGGVLNNFPVDLAKKLYPYNEIIGIALNKFEENQKITTSWENLSVCYDVIMRSKLIENTKLVDHLFYREVPVPVLSLNKKKLQSAFDMWYADCMAMFGK